LKVLIKNVFFIVTSIPLNKCRIIWCVLNVEIFSWRAIYKNVMIFTSAYNIFFGLSYKTLYVTNILQIFDIVCVTKTRNSKSLDTSVICCVSLMIIPCLYDNHDLRYSMVAHRPYHTAYGLNRKVTWSTGSPAYSAHNGSN